MIYYEETYGKYYDENVSEDQLMELIREGKIAEPDECVNSRAVKLYGNDSGYQYQVMADTVDRMSDHEKEFYLWLLLRWYEEKKLPGELPDNTDTRENFAVKVMIENIIKAAKEMEEILCYDLW